MPRQDIAGYIQYRYICEQCGVQTEWIKKELRMKSEARSAGYSRSQTDRLLLGMAGAVKRNVEKGDLSEFTAGTACPQCAARQSWLNPMTKGNVIVSVVVTMLACVFIGVLIGGPVSMLGVSHALAVMLALGAAAGIFLSLLKVIFPYYKEKKLALAASGNRAKNTPEIDWDVYGGGCDA